MERSAARQPIRCCGGGAPNWAAAHRAGSVTGSGNRKRVVIRLDSRDGIDTIKPSAGGSFQNLAMPQEAELRENRETEEEDAEAE